jgi:hypothetical protein
MERVPKPSTYDSYVAPSEPFRIYLISVRSKSLFVITHNGTVEKYKQTSA